MLQAVTSRVIHQHEYPVSAFEFTESKFRQFLSEAKLGRKARTLFQSSSEIHAVILRLVRKISMQFPGYENPEVPLLVTAIYEGITARQVCGDSGATPLEMDAQFLYAVLKRMEDIARYNVHAVDQAGDGHRWDAVQGGNLVDWASRQADRSIVFVPKDFVSPGEISFARSAIAVSVLDMRIAQALDIRIS